MHEPKASALGSRDCYLLFLVQAHISAGHVTFSQSDPSNRSHDHCLYAIMHRSQVAC